MHIGSTCYYTCTCSTVVVQDQGLESLYPVASIFRNILYVGKKISIVLGGVVNRLPLSIIYYHQTSTSCIYAIAFSAGLHGLQVHEVNRENNSQSSR